jgi:LPS export ABC transporter protein LptC
MNDLPRMKHPVFNFRFIFLFISIIVLASIFLSCENKIGIINKSDLLTLPSVTVKDDETVYNDSGRVKLILHFRYMEQFDTKEFPYTEFKFGITVDLFDTKKGDAGHVTSKYAKYNKSNSLWELRDSVVVVNEKNDKLETELLFWNQITDRIYTDRFVKITSTDEEIQGIGFESDTHLQNQRIKKVSAIIYFSDEK